MRRQRAATTTRNPRRPIRPPDRGRQRSALPTPPILNRANGNAGRLTCHPPPNQSRRLNRSRRRRSEESNLVGFGNDQYQSAIRRFEAARWRCHRRFARRCYAAGPHGRSKSLLRESREFPDQGRWSCKAKILFIHPDDGFRPHSNSACKASFQSAFIRSWPRRSRRDMDRPPSASGLSQLKPFWVFRE